MPITVRDVVIVDPEQGVCTHYRPGRPRAIQRLPQQLDLECGCRIQLPD